MKKWIAVLLAVLTVLTFTACNEEGPSHTPAPSASAAGQSGQSVAETLTKAAEKTGNAKSFVLTYGTKMELSETVNDYTKTFSAVTDSDGNMTALCVQPVYDYETGNTVEKVMYISGNYAYEENPVAYSRYTKYVSDTALAQYIIASEFDGFIKNENFLTDFAAMKPASDRQENGSLPTKTAVVSRNVRWHRNPANRSCREMLISSRFPAFFVLFLRCLSYRLERTS